MVNLLEKLKLDNKKIILLALASLAIVYIDFSFIIKSQLKGIKDTVPKITKLKIDMATLSKDLISMQDLKTKQATTKEIAALKTKKIISEDRIPSLLQDISEIANKNNIKIMQIKPSRELRPKEDALTKEASKVAPVLINLNLVCSYHNFGSFINDIENAQGLMVVEGLKIESDPMNYLQQKVKLILRTYVKE